VKGVTILIGVNGYRSSSAVFGGPSDSDGNLTAVSDEDLADWFGHKTKAYWHKGMRYWRLATKRLGYRCD
jgi:hypothetical protein